MTKFTDVFNYLFFPQSVFLRSRRKRWYLRVFLPIICCGLAFLQVGIDKQFAGVASFTEVVLTFLFGILCGLIFTTLTVALLLVIGVFSGTRIDYTTLTHAFCICWIVPLITSIIGTIVVAVGIRGASSAFGVASLLIVLIPLYNLIMHFKFGGIKKRKYIALPFITIIGCLYLTALALIMNM